MTVSRRPEPGRPVVGKTAVGLGVQVRVGLYFGTKIASRSRLRTGLSPSPLRELRTTVTAHQDDRQGGLNPLDFVRQLGADQIRHRFIGEYEIEALRLGLKRLQRRGARFEAHGLIAEPGKHFLGERNQRTLVVDNHHGFAVSAWQLADGLDHRSSGFSLDCAPALTASTTTTPPAG